MLDVNGEEFRKGGMASLLCEVLDLHDDHVHLRVLNSDHELAVGARYDEPLGGLVADSELTVFVEGPAPAAPDAASAEHEQKPLNLLNLLPLEGQS